MIGLTTRLCAFRLALAFVAALPIAGPGRAETERVYRIGLLLNTHLADGINTLIVELRGLGYVEGRNLVLDWRLVESAERNAGLAAELVSLKPDILLAAGSQQVAALKRATASIPIVFVNTGDPVGLHLVDSLARPGGNITGIANYVPELAGKRLEMIGEVVPSAQRIAMLFNPLNPLSVETVRETETAASARTIVLVQAPVRSAEELPSALQRVASIPARPRRRGDRMRRREFIALLGGVAAWPLPLSAQQPDGMRRIGVLMAYGESDREGQAWVAAFREGLQKLGWTEGRNIGIDIRWPTADEELIERFAKELVALRPDLILTQNTPTTAAILRQTRTIPIIFANVFDPVSSRLVASLPRPGGNVTGFLNLEGSIAGKWLELLKEVAPRVTRVAFLFHPATAPFAEYFLNPFKAAAASFAVEAIAAPVRDTPELESAFAAQARAPYGGLIVMPDAFLNVHRAEITSLAAGYRLPAVYPYRFFAELGGLLSYGSDPLDNFRRAASYVDRILKGAMASELPVQAPVKFELVINLKTTKALGLTVAPSLLARADEVIE